MKTDEEIEKDSMKRVKANDPVALFQMGARYKDEGNYEGAFKYFTKAATLGEADAHYNLSLLYATGEGVEMNEKKKVYHLEEAAISGHPYARYNLGAYEARKGRIDRAAKHYIIAAKLGHDEALERVKEGFAGGFVKKEDFEAALRGHQAAVDATKSEQREEAYAFFQQVDHKRCRSQK
jgi:TPR repeat protein